MFQYKFENQMNLTAIYEGVYLSYLNIYVIDYDVKPLKQLKFLGGQNAYSAPSIVIFGGQLPPLPPTSRVHENQYAAVLVLPGDWYMEEKQTELEIENK